MSNNPSLVEYHSKLWGNVSIIEEGVYADSSPALRLYQGYEPIATLTVNADIGAINVGYYVIKTWRENKEIAAELLELGVFEATGATIECGNEIAQIWKLSA